MLEAILNNIVEITCAFVIATAGFAIKMIGAGVKLLKAIGHDKLYRYARFYISTNQITVEELKNLEHVYEGYHGLGGNGTGTELFEKCKELPIVENRTEWNTYYTGKAAL